MPIETMMHGRYFLEVSYFGGAYHGWQLQENALSIQHVMEINMEKILGEKVLVTASGRTDTGVHAYQQVVHIDVQNGMEPQNFLYKLNAVLPLDIAINRILPVKPDAHARFSAVERGYIYKMHKFKNPFKHGYSYYYPIYLDVNKMNDACEHLIGEMDFQSFSRVKTAVRHFMCNIYEARWTETDEQYLFTISANRFLRGMVRAIVGSLIEVGKGSIAVEEIKKILETKDRRAAGRAVPACGLYLSSVRYPDDIFITK